MNGFLLSDLRASVVDRTAFSRLENYRELADAFLDYLAETAPTKIISPSHNDFIFYQYGPDDVYRITRPLNTRLFVPDRAEFAVMFDRFADFLGDLKRQQEHINENDTARHYLETNEINRIVYTLQQSIGCVADSFSEANQARKRAGQLFETLVKLLLREVGLVCEPRTINVPIPGYDGYLMKYELDVVFSRNQAIIAAESHAGTLHPDGPNLSPAVEPTTPTPAAQVKFLAAQEIVGSIKTTSKDRIDKVFLDKYLLTKFLGRDVPVIAIFLHDVQRAASGRGEGRSIFGVASTFKTGHFLGYTVALNRLDGVYYVDPRPEMRSNVRLREHIHDFQQFLTRDLWVLSR